MLAEPEDLVAGKRVFSVRSGDRELLPVIGIVATADGPRRTIVCEMRSIQAIDRIILDFVPAAGSLPPAVAGIELVCEAH